MKEKFYKKNVLLSLTVLFLLVVVAGAAYSYLALNTNKAQGDVVAISGSTDSLMFMTDKEINIHVTKDTLAEGKGDLHDQMKVTARLVPNNTTNEARTTYNGFFVIDNNTFLYTTEDRKPEILLKVTDPNGNEVTHIEGLRYVGNGFDITNRTGGFLIRSDYEIAANNGVGTVQEWQIEVTFVNLDTNQKANAGKDFSGKVYFTQDKINTYRLTKIRMVNTTASYDKVEAETLVVPGTALVQKYYYAIREIGSTEELNYEASESNRFVFKNLKDNTTYKLYVYAIDVHGILSNVYETDVTTDQYEYPVISDVLASDIDLFSFTLTATAQGGTNEVLSYLFSIDDGESYVESSSSVYTFQNLDDTSTYKVKVKVKDTIGKESNVYTKDVETETYINPSVVTANVDASYNSVEVDVTALAGTNEISKYYFRKGMNTNWVEVGGNNYTFTGLSESQNYNFYVKVVDVLGRESEEYEIANISTRAYILPQVLNVSITPDETSLKIDATSKDGDGSVTGYKYSRDGGSNWYSSTSSSYTFNNLTSSTTFQIWVKVVDSNGRESTVYKTEGTTLDAGLCPKGTNLAECVKSQYTSQGSNNLYYHTSTLANSTEDGSYRYSGASSDTSNWVCFGTADKDECLSNQNYLYRIIGVFGNKVKLIRNTSYKTAYWPGKYGSNYTNVWADSTLNTQVLNSEYLNEFETAWNSKISYNDWQVAKLSSDKYSFTPKAFYRYELGSSSKPETYNSKVAMMYVSEYGYAAYPSAWNTGLSHFDQSNTKTNNWMFSGKDEWMLTPTSSLTQVFYIYAAGNVMFASASGTKPLSGAVRPTFYLNSDVQFGTGLGTLADPIMIYDDGYVYPKIDIKYTTSSSSISLAGTVTKGTANLGNLMTSFDGGTTWETTALGSESSYSYTSSKVNLPSNTNYQVWVKVIDANGRESEIVKMSITTDYVMPVVNNVTVSNITGTGFTVTATATPGSGTLKTYYFSTNGGSSYSSVSSTANSASKTFTSLAGGTTFNIKVYVKDSNNKSSDIFTTSATTPYTNPSVTNVQVTNITQTGFTVTATGRAGSSSLRTYYFSTDGGKTYSSVSSSSTSASKTFSGLSAGTSYNIKVYVVDSGGKSSTTYSTGATTLSNVAPSITNVVVSDITSTSFKITATGKAGTGTLQTYYFSVNGGSTYYSVSSTSTTASREFTGLTKNTTYNIKVYVKDSNNLSSSVYSTTGRTGATLADTCRSGSALYSCIENSFVDQGVNDLYHHTSSLAYGTGDNSYRYAGADPNNYICFGTNASVCPDNNLYRIIGVWGTLVKVIKNTSYGDHIWNSFEWTGMSINYWQGNSLMRHLHDVYGETFESVWRNLMIAQYWGQGGITYNSSKTAKQWYDEEMSDMGTAYYSISLMYVSDYLFAASPTYWSSMSNYTGINKAMQANNWIDAGMFEWTMTRNKGDEYGAYNLIPGGGFNTTSVDTNSYPVRPVFYLRSSAYYASGTGTKNDPIRLKVS